MFKAAERQMKHSMKCASLEIGQLVRSKAGRDQGQYYLVIKAEPGRVWLVDGYGRTKANAKPKNPRHLQPVGRISQEFAQKVGAGRLTPEDMRACLQAVLKNNPDINPSNPSMDEEALVNVESR